MYLGPIHPTLPGLGTGHNPIKQIKVITDIGHQAVLFDREYPFALTSKADEFDVPTILWESSQAAVLARMGQLNELANNAEWQRCGIYVIWREDAIVDPNDGWFTISEVDLNEALIVSAYANPHIKLQQRTIKRTGIGTYMDAKLVANDANLDGIPMAALPQGFATPYPKAAYTLTGANGDIQIFESSPSVIRASFVTPLDTMTKGRCRVNDQTVSRSVQTEVFWKDHRNLNGYWEMSNDIVRYYFTEGSTAPSIDVWDAYSATWVSEGSYQLQTTNVGPVLPVQTAKLETISPEEVVWTEWRYDAAGTSLVTVKNRIRRGSRIIESQIVAASGAGLTGTQSIGIVAAPNVSWTVASSTDLQAVVYSDGFETAGTVQTLWRSIGTDALGTLAYWTIDVGSPTIAANVLSVPTGASLHGGHPDWGDTTTTIRTIWATTGLPSLCVHWTDASNYVQMYIDGGNLVLRKVVAGTPTVLASTSFVPVNGTPYWLRLAASGTTFTATVFADSAGAIGGSLVTNNGIAANAPAAGKIALIAVGGGTSQYGGAFSNVCQVTGTAPKDTLGNTWAPGITAGEPAFAWSTTQVFSGTRSLSIYNAISAGQGYWVGSVLPAATELLSANVWGNGTPTSFQVIHNPTIAAPSNGLATANSTWQSVSASGANGAIGNVSCLAYGVGTYYFDNVSVSAGGTGVVFANALLSDGFEATSGGTALLFRSIGSDATGTLNAWTTDAGAPSIATSVVTVPAGAALHAGHPDWDDGTVTVRFRWSTGGNAFVYWHYASGTDWVRVGADGANLFLQKLIGSVSSFPSIVPAVLVNATQYWLRLTSTGTSYTATIYADAAGALGAQITTTGPLLISDASVVRGPIRLESGGATILFGGAFGNVCTVTGPVPTGWSVAQGTGEPAWCWSKAKSHTGTYSLSIYNAHSSAQAWWQSPNVPTVGGTAYTVAVLCWGLTGSVPANFYANINFGGGAANVTCDSTWRPSTATTTPGANQPVELLAYGAGTYYFDAVAVYRTTAAPGFVYLTQNPYAPTFSGTNIYSGAIVPAGTITRIGLLCGVVDAQYASLGTGQLYAGKWAAYNRYRVKQRILIDTGTT